MEILSLIEQPSRFIDSPWISVIAVAAALCLMAAVNAWDKRHKW